LVLQGTLLGELQRFDQALDALDRATQLKPREPEAFLAAGRILRESGQVETSIQHLLWCQGLAPVDATICHELGLCLEAGGFLVEAIEPLTRSVHQEPERVDSLVALARVLNQTGYPRDALEAASRATTLDKERAAAWWELGQAELGVGEELARGHHHRARGLFLRGDLELTLAECHRALVENPEHVEAWSLRGEALLALDRLTDAAEAFQRSLEFGPGDVELWLKLGHLLWGQLDRKPEALPCFRRASLIRTAVWFELPREIRDALDQAGESGFR
jgi:tetratricopeptide (TPR) repeat protein